MPKRIGHLFEQVLTLENCIQAEWNMARNKPDNRMARHIKENAERYGARLQKALIEGYVFHESRTTTIIDSYKGKERNLKIPCLFDQAAQQAWLNIAAPYIEKRNYYYNCGSIPNAGQIRPVKAIKKWLKNPKVKYASVTDIKHFYETCPHSIVIKGLKRMFKDSRFIAFAKSIMLSMSKTGVGLAIGHPTSHWFANVALMELDHAIKRNFPSIKYARYMDDMVFLSTNKRKLWKAIKFLFREIEKLSMEIKHTWQVFPIKSRGVSFLSYRFFNGYNILQKKLMYRISRKAKRAGEKMSVHTACGLISYVYGICKHCNSFNFRQSRIYPFVSPKNCRRLISYASKNKLLQPT